MAHLTRAELADTANIPDRSEIVVVGAGMAGLYVSWRLLREDPAREICILERIDRTGGRLDSDVIRFDDGERVKEEEGGMRFTFDTMDDLMSLFLILGIDDQIVPFPMNSGGNNRLHFRGHAFTNAEARRDDFAIWSELYDLQPAERGLDPKIMINTVFNRILAENPQFKHRPSCRTPTFWQDFRLDCCWNGVALKDWTLWNLLDAMGYSNECITLLYRVLGFNGTFLSEMNAGEAFQLLEDFPAEPEFKTLENGFSTLPNALVRDIGTERIFTGTNVDRIEDRDEDGYTLSYTTAGADGAPRTGTIRAQKVVLALPRLALEKLYIHSDALNRLDRGQAHTLWNTLQTTTNQPLLKINLYYDKAWWGNKLSGEAPVSFGPNFSDLPLGSVYPFYALDEALFAAAEYQAWATVHDYEAPVPVKLRLDAIAAAKFERPAALTIYCDYLNINFWRALQRNGELFNSSMQEKCSRMDLQTVYPASEAVVNAATGFFRKLFNTHYVPRPVLTSARIWSGSTRFDTPPAEQVGYGVHQWGLHADDRQVMAALVEPMAGLYTCGEAYSDYQGWVEGALRSADRVLATKGLGCLKPISEVYQEEHGISPSEAIKAAHMERATTLIRQYVDPDFDPGAGGEALDLTRTQPTTCERFGVTLTYFDEAAKAAGRE